MFLLFIITLIILLLQVILKILGHKAYPTVFFKSDQNSITVYLISKRRFQNVK